MQSLLHRIQRLNQLTQQCSTLQSEIDALTDTITQDMEDVIEQERGTNTCCWPPRWSLQVPKNRAALLAMMNALIPTDKSSETD